MSLEKIILPEKEIIVVTFDLEGTTVNLGNVHHKAHELSAKAFGINLTVEQFLKNLDEFPHFIGGPDEEIAKEIAKYGLKHFGIYVDPKEIHYAKKFYYNNLLPEFEIRPREGFLEFFFFIKSLGFKYAIGSLTSTGQAMHILDQAELLELFGLEKIILKEDVRNLKPHPEVYIKTAELHGVSPSKQIVFEDSPNGVRAAKSAGSMAYGMPVYYDNPKVIQQLKDAGVDGIFNGWCDPKLYDMIKLIYERSNL
ncbi:MAG: HAD family phosphatase [Candidatus Woesearchaeota archaeon]